MKRHSLLLFFLVLSLVHFSVQAGEPSVINIGAEGIVKTKADTALINIDINAAELNADKARHITDQQVSKLLSLLKEFDLKEGSLDSSQTSIYTEYDYNVKPRQLLAYRANRNVSFALVKLEQLESLVKAVSQLEHASLNQIQFSVEDIRAWEDTALKHALQIAKSKAEIIAKEMSVKLTGIHRVTHQVNRSSPPVFARAMMLEKDMGASGTYEQKDLEVTAYVDVSFTFK